MPKRMVHHKPQRMKASIEPIPGYKKHQIYGSRWQRLRLYHLRRFPLCNRCEQEGRLEAATQVHHVHDVSQGGPLLPASSGLESLCISCHSKHTRQTQLGR